MGKSAEWYAIRALANSVVCPDCHMPPGTVCRNQWTGQPVNHQAAHPGRIALSEKTPPQSDHAPVDNRDTPVPPPSSTLPDKQGSGGPIPQPNPQKRSERTL